MGGTALTVSSQLDGLRLPRGKLGKALIVGAERVRRIAPRRNLLPLLD